ncbi:glycosyltransferase [Segetibacter sp. 3557_3]|nr:glycosyltransferase [Segetibacter sp. 3557_3]
MQRICSSLSRCGYRVTLVGRGIRSSQPLKKAAYEQRRLYIPFTKGKSMYLLFNIRLLIHLFLNRTDIICAIDLDTILPCYIVSRLYGIKRVYDAHELFTEQKEIVTRPLIHAAWLKIEQFAVPRFPNGYTVNQFIKAELERRYQVYYKVVRNLPVLEPLTAPQQDEPFIIYQGAVNKGRSFETLIPAMRHVPARLVICGDGNFLQKVEELVKLHKVDNKVTLSGSVLPAELRLLTPRAFIGLTLFENMGLNQYQSLANRFFDYIMAGIPQVCVGYPEYKRINDDYEVALLIDDTNPVTIADAINRLLNDTVLYARLKHNCLLARKVLCWNREEITLLSFYKNLLT